MQKSLTKKKGFQKYSKKPMREGKGVSDAFLKKIRAWRLQEESWPTVDIAGESWFPAVHLYELDAAQDLMHQSDAPVCDRHTSLSEVSCQSRGLHLHESDQSGTVECEEGPGYLKINRTCDMIVWSVLCSNRRDIINSQIIWVIFKVNICVGESSLYSYCILHSALQLQKIKMTCIH